MNGEKNDYKEFQANQGFSSSTNEMSDVPPAPTNRKSEFFVWNEQIRISFYIPKKSI